MVQRGGAFSSPKMLILGRSKQLFIVPFHSMHINSKTLRMGLLDGFKKMDFNQALAVENDKTMKVYLQNVEKINALEEAFEKLSDDELRMKTAEFKDRLKGGQTLGMQG
eukprot:gene42587-52036_t